MEKTFNESCIEMLENDSKIGILMTKDETGYPHLTFLSSIQARGESGVTFGQFCVGLSKKFIKERPDTAFLALDATYQFIRGRARYTHTETTGEVFDEYNNKPLFRYNTYFGFNTIYFIIFIEHTGLNRLEMPKIVLGAVLSRIKALFAAKSDKHAMNRTAKGLFAELDGLKFIGYFDADGKPWIIPVIQAGPAGSDRVAFSSIPFGEEIRQIPAGAKVSVLAVNLKMQSVLVKGIYSGKGVVDIERLYNSMPLKAEYVYPRPEKLEPVTRF